MGAEYCTFYPRGETPEEIRKEFYAKQEELCEEQGRDAYAGHLGICPGLDIEDKVFNSEQEAEEYLEDNCIKWENALAVSYKQAGQVADAAGKKLKERQRKLQQQIDSFPAERLADIKAAKSKTIGCKCCGSAISRAYLRTIRCPVCSDSFFTKTDNARLTRMGKRLRDLQRIPVSKKAGVRKQYIIGGACAC
jgi:hypothetical protein